MTSITDEHKPLQNANFNFSTFMKNANGNNSELEILKEKNKILADENELVLLQNQQLQEELEHLFIEYQQLQGRTDDSFLGEKSDYLFGWLKKIKRTRNYNELRIVKKKFGGIELALKGRNTDLVDQLRCELNTLESDSIRLSSDNARMCTELVKLNENLSKLERLNSTVIAEKNQLFSELIDLKENFLELEGLNLQLISEKKQLASNAVELEEKLLALDSLNSKLTREKDVLSIDLKQLRVSVDELTKDHVKGKILKENLTLLKKEKDEFEKESLKFNAETQKLRELNKVLIDEKSDLELTLERTISSNEVDQKLLVKAQIDLENLRKSFADKVETEKELVALINQLKGKLTLASKYYFRIQQEYPDLIVKYKQRVDGEDA